MNYKSHHTFKTRQIWSSTIVSSSLHTSLALAEFKIPGMFAGGYITALNKVNGQIHYFALVCRPISVLSAKLPDVHLQILLDNSNNDFDYDVQ